MPAFRHQHGHLRLDLAGDADHLVGGRHFQVELDVGQFAQAPHVVILNVATIFAQMHGNAVGPAQMGFNCRPYRIRFVGFPRLAHRCHVVYVYAQFDHSSCNSMKTLRDCRGLPPI